MNASAKARHPSNPIGWHFVWGTPRGPVFHVSMTSSTGANAHFGIGRSFVRQQDAVREVPTSELEDALAVALAGTALACGPRSSERQRSYALRPATTRTRRRSRSRATKITTNPPTPTRGSCGSPVVKGEM